MTPGRCAARRATAEGWVALRALCNGFDCALPLKVLIGTVWWPIGYPTITMPRLQVYGNKRQSGQPDSKRSRARPSVTHRAAGSRTSVRPSGSVRGMAKRCSASSTGVTIGIGLEGLFKMIEAYISCTDGQRCWLHYWTTRQALKQPIPTGACAFAAAARALSPAHSLCWRRILDLRDCRRVLRLGGVSI